MIEPKSVIRPIKVQFQGGMQPSDLAQYEVIVGAFSYHSSLFCHFCGAYSSLFCQFLVVYSSLFYQKVVSLHAEVLYFFSE